jgi:hypothetical protein
VRTVVRIYHVCNSCVHTHGILKSASSGHVNYQDHANASMTHQPLPVQAGFIVRTWFGL